jgi:enamine deaminase RidA (YjgF/YER057c/UK114 family)
MTTLTPEERLQQLGWALPAPPAAVGAYVAWVRTGPWVVTSGQLPWRDGRMAVTGRLGEGVTVEQGYEAARYCALNALAQLKQALGELRRVRQIVRLEGYVHCGPGFRAHPQVLNGASELLNEVFGERGRHARLAVGIHEMPLDAAVQICLTVEVED